MSPRRHLLALGALAALLVLGLGLVFQRRLARDLYPPYSSFRADPLGTRALHDAVAALPGLRVDRALVPVQRLPTRPPRTLLLLGAPRRDWTALPPDDFAALDAALRAGSRVVLCLEAENYAPTSAEEKAETVRATALEQDASERAELKKAREAKEAPPEKPASPPANEQKPAPKAPTPTAPPLDAFARWGFKVEIQRDHDGIVTPGAAAGVTLPDDLPWGSDLVLVPETAADWAVVCERGGRPLLAERRVGDGTLVVATDSFFVSNEALQRARATPLLVRLLGAGHVIVFVESHLGVVEDPGIAALARRYGLMPAFTLCGVLALLFIWRRASTFVPPPPADVETALDYRPTSSLAALLRRAVPPAQLLPTCLAEWRRTARPGELARVESALDAASDPVSGYNAAVAALHRRPGQPTPKS
jgi:hypothetical protein